MNDIKCQLLVHAVPVAPRVGDGGLGAGHDFAMLEGDDIRGAREVHEALVHRGDDPVGNDGDLDFLDRAEGKAPVGGTFPAVLEGEAGEVAEPGQADAHGPLAIVNLNAQAAETGGTLGRGAGSGVPVFSVRDSG